MRRLSEENAVLTAAEAEWIMREKSLDEQIRELERQLENLTTAVCTLHCSLGFKTGLSKTKTDSAVLNIFETEQLQIGKWVETR